jgi:hypothetical protein
MRNTPLSCTARLSDERKQSGIGRETHKMMLDHYQQTNKPAGQLQPEEARIFLRLQLVSLASPFSLDLGLGGAKARRRFFSYP